MRSSPTPATFFQSARASSSRSRATRVDEPLRIDRRSLGQQLPGERDRVGLEVVAEREVAQHLEERVVARGAADVLEVVVLAAGAHALLRRWSRARTVGLRLAGEDVLELVHPGVGEQQRRVVVRDQRRARRPRCGPACAKKSRNVRRTVSGVGHSGAKTTTRGVTSSGRAASATRSPGELVPGSTRPAGGSALRRGQPRRRPRAGRAAARPARCGPCRSAAGTRRW